MFTTLSTIQDFLNPYADREVREKERKLLDSYFLRQTGIPGWVYGSVNVDISPRILHLESGIRGWRGKSLLPANLARTSARKTCVH